MDSLPDNLLLQIFSSIPWRQRVKFESVSKRWYRILLDKSFQIIGRVDLDGFAKDNLLLPLAIQSLVVKKRKIINELISNNESVNFPVSLVLEFIISAQPNSLTRLNLKGTHQMISSVSPLIHLLLNLELVQMEMVEVKTSRSVCVDLSQLIRLKCLIGHRVHYRNCRSPCLTEVHYSSIVCYISHSYPSNCRDFIQMITVAAPVIEVISLSTVRFMTSRDDKQGVVVLTLPRLLKLKICRCFLPGTTFDLEGCSNLQEINIHDRTYDFDFEYFDADFKIINLDLSVHSLVSLSTNDSVMLDQFLVSALQSPERLSLLEEFVVDRLNFGFMFDRLIEIFNQFSLFYTCALSRVEIDANLYQNNFLDSNCLVVLVKCSPHLTLLNFDHLGIDKQCLIDLIILTVSISNDLDIRFRTIVNGTLSDFISDLLVALSLINSSIICKSKVRFVVEYKHSRRVVWNENRSNLEYIVDRYGIIIASGFSEIV